MNLKAERIQAYIDSLVSKGYIVGPRCGFLTCVNGIWRDDRWLARHSR